MPGYRIYEIGQDGHVVRLLAELTLDNDVTRLRTRNSRHLWKQLRFGKASGWSIVFVFRQVPQM